MKLFEGGEFKIEVYDIETYRALSLFTFHNPDTDEWKEFEISEYQNDIYSFIKFYEDHPVDFQVSFNGIGFDKQVIEWVRKNYKKWYDRTGQEIAKMVADYASFVIDNSHHKVRHEFYENQFHVPEIDLFKIWHYDRELRATSLKKLEFSMDFPNIEELPIDTSKDSLTREEIQQIKDYCRNDVLATEEFLQYTIGNTEHTIYKQDNKIQLRFDLKEEFKMDSINISNTKIGDNIIKKEYCKIAKVAEKDLPKKGYFRKYVKMADAIPDYVTFKTYKLQEFLRNVRKIKLKSGEEYSEKIEIAGKTYRFAKGGLHSDNKGEIYRTEGDYLIIDWDVTSYYPWIMINNGYAPKHIDKEAFIKALRTIVEERTRLKPLAKKDKKIAGKVNGFKISANSVYGFSSDMYSWLYDALVTLQVCITGELSLLMLIEAYTEAGLEVISANTDGVTLRIHKDNIDKMLNINQEWMNLTGYSLDRTNYNFIAFSTVNDYIAQKDDGEMKYKGDFLIDSELHGDKSRRIVRLALNEYFVNNKEVEDTIRNHKNVYDFCIGVKSSKDYHFELLDRGVSPYRHLKDEKKRAKFLESREWKSYYGKWEKNIEDEESVIKLILSTEEAFRNQIMEDESKMGERDVLKKMVRYYISNEGRVILKVKNPDSEKTGNKESQVESPSRVNNEYQPLVKYFNTFEEKEDYDINFNYYIRAAKERIDFILKPKNKKGKVIEVNPNQLDLFA